MSQPRLSLPLNVSARNVGYDGCGISGDLSTWRTAMQGAVVMAIALTSLGCHNKSDDVIEVPPLSSAIGSEYTNPYPRYTTPSSYSGFYKRSYSDDVSDVYPTHWDAWRATLCSFVLGHDPGMPDVREIEASVYGDYSSH
jgi:hypothetical protein